MKTKEEVQNRVYELNNEIILLSKAMEDEFNTVFMEENDYSSLYLLQKEYLIRRDMLKWVLDE